MLKREERIWGDEDLAELISSSELSSFVDSVTFYCSPLLQNEQMIMTRHLDVYIRIHRYRACPATTHAEPE